MPITIEQLETRRFFAAGDQDLTYGDDGFLRLKFADAAYQFLPGSDPAASATVVAMSADGANFSIRRFNAGVPDATAGPGGTIATNPLPFDPGAGRQAQPSRIWNLSGGRTLIEFIVPTSRVSADGYVVRLNPDRSLDTTYGADGFVFFPGGLKLQVQQQGDKFITTAGVPNNRLARYTEDFVLDTTFGTNGMVLFPNPVRLQPLHPDGKIFALSRDSESPTNLLFRLDSNGHADLTFGGGDGRAPLPGLDGIAGIVLDSAGRIVVSAETALARLTPDGGALDSTFGDNGILVPFSDFSRAGTRGEVLLEDGGMVAPMGGHHFIRVDADGKYDAAYGRVVVDLRQPAGQRYHTYFEAELRDLPNAVRNAQKATAQPDGSVLIARRFLDGTFVQVRIDADGNDPGNVGLAGGVITVSGTAGDDRVLIDEVAPSDRVATVNGVGRAFASADVASYHVQAHAGDDVVVIEDDGDLVPARVALIEGGDGDDRLVGGRAADTILGNAGHDRIDGRAGNDRLEGNGGNDKLSGGPADSPLDADRDRLFGGAGNDRLAGQADADILDGGVGDDFLDGGAGADRMMGSDGNDTFLSDNDGQSVDDLYGGGGNDTLLSGDGDDLLTSIETT